MIKYVYIYTCVRKILDVATPWSCRPDIGEVNVDLTELHPFSLPSSPKAPNTSPEAQRKYLPVEWVGKP